LTAVLPDDLAVIVEARALDRAADKTRPQWRALLARLIARLDPDGEHRRHTTARTTREVTYRPLPDGMGSLWARLSAVDTEAVWQTLCRLAKALGPDDPRTMDQRRADLLVDLCTGRLTLTDTTAVTQQVNAALAHLRDTDNPSTDPDADTDSTPAASTTTTDADASGAQGDDGFEAGANADSEARHQNTSDAVPGAPGAADGSSPDINNTSEADARSSAVGTVSATDDAAGSGGIAERGDADRRITDALQGSPTDTGYIRSANAHTADSTTRTTPSEGSCGSATSADMASASPTASDTVEGTTLYEATGASGSAEPVGASGENAQPELRPGEEDANPLGEAAVMFSEAQLAAAVEAVLAHRPGPRAVGRGKPLIQV
ncbi:DUF222 domain-containing protein, partial [Pseudonocardia sp. NPDC049154]|uniref:DUF222 domain-containing protein n=1 Tax=Pseudonocardia sp. NPDC049154 TaxID=3155501 RepID=UPI0033FE31C7